MEKLNTKVVALSMGVFLAVIYVLCVLFDLFWPVLSHSYGAYF